MGIHYSYIKRAEKMGVILSEEKNESNGSWRVKAFWPEHNLTLFGSDGRDAIFQMEMAQEAAKKQDVEDTADHAAMKLQEQTLSKFTEDPPPTVNNVPTNGRAAHRKGHSIMDCPFDEETPEWYRWNDEWERSAEAAATGEDDEEEKKPASVVKPKYRAMYAEAGHPTHCGDELAEKLNNLVHNAKGTSIEFFDRIMTANEIDMSKYNRTSPGWQGRYRMTGRNMLAKKVHANGGVLIVPGLSDEDPVEVRLSADWMASQRFQK
jgi:hypothetical protein